MRFGKELVHERGKRVHECWMVQHYDDVVSS